MTSSKRREGGGEGGRERGQLSAFMWQSEKKLLKWKSGGRTGQGENPGGHPHEQ